MEEKVQRQESREANTLPANDEAMSLTDRAKYVAATTAATGLGAAVMGFGEYSFLVAAAGGVAGFVFSDNMRNFIIDHAPAPRRARTRNARLNWWLTGQVDQKEQEQTSAPTIPDQAIPPQQEQESTNDDLFSEEEAKQQLPFARLIMEEIIAHIPANSYRVYMGRSVLGQGNKARAVNILMQHLKLIGASQFGKSSMAACILEQIIRTHDLEHALIAILDLEDRTGRLFENDPHIVTFRMNKDPMSAQDIKMHARNKEQVLEYLGYIVQLMDYRYQHSEAEIEHMPLLVVYIEEFLALKDYYKMRITGAKNKEAAQKDYNALIYAISELARRGLKARIQLLLCAQVDYRDEDLCEAMANITAGMSFCVKPSAAKAAGFTDEELLKRNYRDSIKGQAVSEFAGCKDLLLAPDYPLRQKLIELERRSGRSGRPDAFGTPGTPFVARAQEQNSQRSDDRNDQDDEQGRPENEGIPANVRTFPTMAGTTLTERRDDRDDERPAYRFTEQEIPLLLAAYRASSNVDKACQALHKSAPRYRAHAKEIIAAYNARQA